VIRSNRRGPRTNSWGSSERPAERAQTLTSGFSRKPATAAEILLAPGDPDDLLRLADVVSAEGLVAGRQSDCLVVDVDGQDPRHLAASLNRASASAGIVLAELHVRRPTLEDSYFSLIEGESR
jgi:hypothetical protein